MLSWAWAGQGAGHDRAPPGGRRRWRGWRHNGDDKDKDTNCSNKDRNDNSRVASLADHCVEPRKPSPHSASRLGGDNSGILACVTQNSLREIRRNRSDEKLDDVEACAALCFRLPEATLFLTKWSCQFFSSGSEPILQFPENMMSLKTNTNDFDPLSLPKGTQKHIHHCGQSVYDRRLPAA